MGYLLSIISVWQPILREYLMNYFAPIFGCKLDMLIGDLRDEYFVYWAPNRQVVCVHMGPFTEIRTKHWMPMFILASHYPEVDCRWTTKYEILKFLFVVYSFLFKYFLNFKINFLLYLGVHRQSTSGRCDTSIICRHTVQQYGT